MDTDENPLVPPTQLAGVSIPYFSTAAMPINETVGSASNASSIIVGDFSQAIVGIRQDFSLEILKELYRTNLQTGFLAHLRIAVAVTRPKKPNPFLQG